jgi:uncharacterized membrane protein YfcA
MEPAWIIVALAVAFIGVTKSGFGGGLGLLNVPLIVIAMGQTSRGSTAAPGFMLPLLILGDIIAVTQYRRQFSPRALKLLLPGSLLGVIAGYLLLEWFHNHKALLELIIRAEIGFECILLVGLHWWRQYKGVQKNVLPEPWRGTLTGGFAGTSSTLAHAAGPIIAMYLLPLKMERRQFVGTSAFYFFLLNSTKVPFYFAAGMFEKVPWSFSLLFAPLVLGGAIVGWFILRQLSDKRFSQITYFVTFALGWYLLIDGAVRLIAHATG